MKSEIYETLRNLNQYFDGVGDSLNHLQQRGLLPAGFAEARKVAVEEIRARVNQTVALALVDREGYDWSKFEDLRIEANRKEIEEAIHQTERK